MKEGFFLRLFGYAVLLVVAFDIAEKRFSLTPWMKFFVYMGWAAFFFACEAAVYWWHHKKGA